MVRLCLSPPYTVSRSCLPVKGSRQVFNNFRIFLTKINSIIYPILVKKIANLLKLYQETFTTEGQATVRSIFNSLVSAQL